MNAKKIARFDLADARSAASIEARVTNLARRAGLVPKPISKQSKHALPVNLEPILAIRERRRMHRALRVFEALYRAGVPVFHLTWCPLELRVPPGALTPALIKRARDLVSRHARNLKQLGRRMIGAVDISFNPDPAHPLGGEWCIHVHAFVAIHGLSKKKAHAAVKGAFRSIRAQPSSGVKIKPLMVKPIKNEAHLIKTTSYISACLSLVDHNSNQNRHRRFRAPQPNSKRTSDGILPEELGVEFTRLFEAVGPKGFWALSGFRRRGDRIEPDPAFSGVEQQALIDLRRHRREVKKALERDGGGFLAIQELKRLF